MIARDQLHRAIDALSEEQLVQLAAVIGKLPVSTDDNPSAGDILQQVRELAPLEGTIRLTADPLQFQRELRGEWR